jgi:hypothetical protein
MLRTKNVWKVGCWFSLFIEIFEGKTYWTRFRHDSLS